MSDSPTPSNVNLNLIRASYLRKLDAVKEAIQSGADVNTFADRQTPLLIATEIGDDRLVAYLLTVPQVNTDFQNDFGQTALIVAVRNSFMKIVKLLLKHKADVNLSDHMGSTPLHAALFLERPTLVKLLLAYGASIEKEDSFGERPIFTSACKRPNMECLVTLLKMGADVNYLNFSGIPLLSRSLLYGTNNQILEVLVKYGASVNAPDLISRKTPLHFACLLNNLEIIQFLIRKGADVNRKTTYHFTPFDEALFQGNLRAADYLMDVMTTKNKKKPVKKHVPLDGSF